VPAIPQHSAGTNAVYAGTTGTLDLNAQDFEISSLIGAGPAARRYGGTDARR